MNEQEKLRILLSHWIEHNKEHAEEFRRWAVKAGDASDEMLAAVENMAYVNRALAAALEKLGGSIENEHARTNGHRH